MRQRCWTNTSTYRSVWAIILIFYIIHSTTGQDALSSNNSSHTEFYDEASDQFGDNNLFESILTSEPDSGTVSISLLSNKHFDGLYNNFFMDVTYHLIYPALMSPEKSIVCSRKDMVSNDAEMEEIHMKRCEQSVFGFSQSSEGLADGKPSSLEEYCKKVTVRNITMSTDGSNNETLSGFLPGQPYHFEVTIRNITSNQIVSGPLKANHCFRGDKPRYAPATGEGSFIWVNRQDELSDESKIDLYWQPVPALFDSGPGLKYALTCMDEHDLEVLHEVIQDPKQGWFNITKPRNATYSCKLRSTNEFGESQFQSNIHVPNTSQMIDIKRLPQLYATALTSIEYILKWTFLYREIDLRGNVSSFIYWCYTAPAKSDCSFIEGIQQAPGNHYYLKMFTQDRTPRTFGLSSKIGTLYSGIVWVNCVSDLGSRSLDIGKQLKLIEAKGTKGAETSLRVSWRFLNCPLIPVVKSYEIIACNLGHVDPCSSTSDGEMLRAENALEVHATSAYGTQKLNQRLETKVCVNYQVRDSFMLETNLDKLNVSTWYVVRIRFVLQNKSSTDWSDGLIAQTYIDPDEMRGCWRRNKYFHALVASFVLSTLCLLYIAFAHDRLRAFWKLACSVRRSSGHLPVQLEHSDFTSKFYPDENNTKGILVEPKPEIRYHPGPQGEKFSHVKLNCCDSQPGRNILKQRTFILDYIPCQLLTGNKGDIASQESEHSSSIDDLDDDSTSSRSSFLEKILISSAGPTEDQPSGGLQ